MKTVVDGRRLLTPPPPLLVVVLVVTGVSSRLSDPGHGYPAPMDPTHRHTDLHYHGIYHHHSEERGQSPNESYTNPNVLDHNRGHIDYSGVVHTPGHSRDGAPGLTGNTQDDESSRPIDHQHGESGPVSSHGDAGYLVTSPQHHRPNIRQQEVHTEYPEEPDTRTRHPGSGSRHSREVGSCEEPRQSPINIDTCRVQRQFNRRIFLKNFRAYPSSFNLSNTGKDVMGFMTWQGRSPPTISGGGLPGTFVPFAIDMHWGTNDSFGSEHTVNGGRYPLELHIQCRNIRYDGLQEAATKVDGLAVLGVFFSLEPSCSGGRAFTAFAEALCQIQEFDTTVELASPPNLASFLPGNIDDRVEYSGSLTGAPFSEVVSWVVLLTPARILPSELDLLRALRKEGGVPIGNTFRTPRDRCGRKVYRSGFRQLFEKCAIPNVGSVTGFGKLSQGIGLAARRDSEV